ncbi:hypothetical protein JCM15457_1539 [Liquorilactobacillus sucicola DSM 21376 = JCM 15457]|uniref:DUF3290 domain-containing protein n=1 Tax=Liquorilactobacillus sucicola DSM 21376 = JCM 15457 TaxID=1423806 RepID=A0A023CXQ6_9LACO|nr:DUF3290 domain-containing protein [Liquorilactobacillus sucicola]KRN07109.1 hypothetical protein FD15_GL000678 [Liquorilactobacillus sucicola DSM 21376 = JCM 15457]GAJ26604.1 hypothetical protein JCM15457_1539 [Liquorilactobacillus sucicola DSM 21376 = JCM 15457]
MTFFGINYIENQLQLNDFIKYIVTFILLLVLLIVSTLYWRHRIQIKYRDLSIIVLLLLLFMLGLQYSDYVQSESRHSQSSQMVAFIENVAADRHLNSTDVLVNSTQLTDGVIVRIKKNYYRVNLSMDQSNYTLTRTHLMDKKISIEDN